MLTVDARSKIDVMTQLNRSRGILSGTGSDSKYEAKISYLLRRDEVEEGELVVTSIIIILAIFIIPVILQRLSC